ncbi:hypothetical protein RGU70_02810 [Herbaspirillum sp. RTI4]|uniref:hypothetical protein n=1 Tax=Herbaspirillum sp. RTI4 TaxID=3048640 RepID=UPI002AB41109|nr:hypothetical protein [Herbaspirillum sp. RTI4]MDY7577260.1 hypothetical protein [Herbaspirillum sp. RTI4]MEA9980550.1 hypothetical protein [Herbaspirillum sp. RTI4]
MATAATTIHDLAFVKIHQVEMMFLPSAWRAAPSVSLTWHQFDFPPTPNVAPKVPGVYAFVATPNIFNFDYAGGLFYVGKATSLHNRISAYIAEIGKDFAVSGRPAIWSMLNQWNGHLRYFYVTTATVEAAENLEEEMIEAFRPPFNKQYKAATTSRVMRAFS